MRKSMGDRLHNHNDKMDVEAVTKLLVYTTCSAALLTASCVIAKAAFFYFSPAHKASYPTSIPWINNQFECEYSGRNWSNNQCWDKEHSPWF
ncbi:hypothetical protein [Nostoc sp. PCC 7524]|uniref:hypothetical protein n=1 Tax=Nostoc sp. (strain ATCC 29411 / PCC 7524) TaxID=28072 RepID=UPI0011818405|nr:hypothetical protein [Nostoc sp. PCC 7524]